MSDDDLLSPTPEGDLIRRTRERAIPKISIRSASARIGVSPEHWGNVERGYKSVSSAEPPRRLPPASASLIAKMARAVGVKPDELAEAGREDAARELEEMPGRVTPPPPLSVVPSPPESLELGPDDIVADMDPVVRAAAEAHIDGLRPVYRLVTILGPDAPGEAIFPGNPHEADRWNRLVMAGYVEKPGRGYSAVELIWLLAQGRAIDDARRAAEGHRSRSRRALTSIT